MATAAKEEKRIFVIMPFARTIARNEAHLKSFFENNIKRPIETADLKYAYYVYRSGEAFDITAEIVRDVCRADIVIADLSGIMPNPNVMYELGLRLAVSDQPVILIREFQPDNERVFDILGFYTFDYDTLDYLPLEEHLVGKIARLETGEESYVNPVSQIIKSELAKLRPDQERLSLVQQRDLILEGLSAIDEVMAGAYGPLGKGALVTGAGGVSHLEMRGTAIAASQHSANAIEDKGIRFAFQRASELGEELGDGTKLPVLLGVEMIRACTELEQMGATRDELIAGMLEAVDVARGAIREMTLTKEIDGGVSNTAAKGFLEINVAEAVEMAGARGLVTIEDGPGTTTTVRATEGFQWERGAVDDQFVSDCFDRTCTIENARVLVCYSKISGMRELLPILEQVAQTHLPLLILAPGYEDEAVATLLKNLKAGTVRAFAVHGQGTGARQVDFLSDVAVLTGCAPINAPTGVRLENVRLTDLGSARRITLATDETQISGGGGQPEAIEGRIRQLERDAHSLAGFDREKVLERIARLGGRLVTISVGGKTVQDKRLNRYRVESALYALMSARVEGAMPGAGVGMFKAAAAVVKAASGSESQIAGYRLVAAALRRPLRELLRSAGVDVEGITATITESQDRPLAMNVLSRELVDARAASILDSSQQVIRAIELGVDMARTFLETGSWQ